VAVSHVFSNTVAAWTGTVTVFDSQGSTATVAATDLVRGPDWNSAHNQFYTLTGNTIGNSTGSGTNVIFAGSGGISVGGSTGSIVFSGPMLSDFGNITIAPQAGSAQKNSDFWIQPIRPPQPLVCSLARIFMRVASVATAANASSAYVDASYSGVLYTRNVSTLSSVLSFSGTTTASWSSNATGSVTGNFWFDMTFAQTTLTAREYFFGAQFSTTNTATGGANTTALANTISWVNAFVPAIAGGRPFGQNTNNSMALLPGAGLLSTGVTRASIAFSDYSMSLLNYPILYDLKLNTFQ